jgi:hypothetical protein
MGQAAVPLPADLAGLWLNCGHRDWKLAATWLFARLNICDCFPIRNSHGSLGLVLEASFAAI